MQEPDLIIRPEDSQETRALKYLLTYGGHKEGCDRACDGHTDSNTQHLCCSCDWCGTADWAFMALLGGSVSIKLPE